MTDLITMLENLSKSLEPVQSLVQGSGFLLGWIFMIIAVMKLKKIGDSRARGSSSEKMFGPLAYFAGGSALLFLPQAFTVMGTTLFGASGSALEYSSYKAINVVAIMKVIIRTVGIIWFVRGCVLIVHSSDPSVKHGTKGLAFLCAGVMTVNIDGTMAVVEYALSGLESLTKPQGS